MAHTGTSGVSNSSSSTVPIMAHSSTSPVDNSSPSTVPPSEIMGNFSSISPSPADSRLDRSIELTAAILEFAFCLIGILANVLVCWTIVKHRKTFSSTFYTLALALAVPDCVHLSTELLCALPAVFHGLDRTPKLFLYSCGYFADVSFWAIAPLMLIIAINRYMAVCHLESYKRNFTAQKIRILVGFCFSFCFFMPSVMYGCGCYYDFSYAWLFKCRDGGCKEFALNFNATICNSICVGVAVIYALIYIQHRRIQRRIGNSLQTQTDDEKRRRAKEGKLMFQFGLISAVLIAYQIFFWIFLFFANNGPSEMVLNFLVNLNSCISPFLYLTFGSDIRNRLPWMKSDSTPKPLIQVQAVGSRDNKALRSRVLKEQVRVG